MRSLSVICAAAVAVGLCFAGPVAASAQQYLPPEESSRGNVPNYACGSGFGGGAFWGANRKGELRNYVLGWKERDETGLSTGHFLVYSSRYNVVWGPSRGDFLGYVMMGCGTN